MNFDLIMKKANKLEKDINDFFLKESIKSILQTYDIYDYDESLIDELIELLSNK